MFGRKPEPAVVVIPGRTRTEYITTRTEVTEKRAPTDESVRLLREMRAEAEKDRIASFQMPGNTMHGVVEVYQSPIDQTLRAKAVFDINGTRLTADASEYLKGDREPREALLMALHEKVAQTIATEVLINMTRGMKWP